MPMGWTYNVRADLVKSIFLWLQSTYFLLQIDQLQLDTDCRIVTVTMAAAAAAASGDSSDDVLSCVYCLEVEPYLIDPRMLPCGHIFCSTCLQKDAKTNQIIQCANCRWVYIRSSLLCTMLPFSPNVKSIPSYPVHFSRFAHLLHRGVSLLGHYGECYHNC